jgi:hypothetical protein
MLKLKCRKSPYKDTTGKEIWEGNLVDLGGKFRFECYRIEWKDGVWYAVAQLGNYIDPKNRLKLLGNMKVRVIDDTAIVR